MKKVLLVLIALAIASPVVYARGDSTGGATGGAGSGLALGDAPMFDFSQLRISGGYGYLFTPDLDDIDDIPASTVNRAGFSAHAQALLGHILGLENYLYGIEAGYMRTYDYEFEGLFDAKTTFDSYPVLAISQYNFSERKDIPVTPFIQGGVGAAFNTVTVETAGTETTADSTDFALMVGPGASFRLSEQFTIDAMLQYYLLFTGADYTRRLNLNLGLGMRF